MSVAEASNTSVPIVEVLADTATDAETMKADYHLLFAVEKFPRIPLRALNPVFFSFLFLVSNQTFDGPVAKYSLRCRFIRNSIKRVAK